MLERELKMRADHDALFGNFTRGMLSSEYAPRMREWRKRPDAKRSGHDHARMIGRCMIRIDAELSGLMAFVAMHRRARLEARARTWRAPYGNRLPYYGHVEMRQRARLRQLASTFRYEASRLDNQHSPGNED